MSKTLLALSLLPFLAASACSAPRPDRVVCSTSVSVARAVQERDAALAVPKLTRANTQAALSEYARRCVQRWGYRLAGSPEGLETVTTAVLAACDREIAVTTDLTARATDLCPQCQPVDHLQSTMRQQARLAVLQGRLGDCRASDDADQERQKPTPERVIVAP